MQNQMVFQNFLQEIDMQDVLSHKRSPRLIFQVSYLVDPLDAISALLSQPANRETLHQPKKKG
jgi:hypothetical protein